MNEETCVCRMAVTVTVTKSTAMYSLFSIGLYFTYLLTGLLVVSAAVVLEWTWLCTPCLAATVALRPFSTPPLRPRPTPATSSSTATESPSAEPRAPAIGAAWVRTSRTASAANCWRFWTSCASSRARSRTKTTTPMRRTTGSSRRWLSTDSASGSSRSTSSSPRSPSSPRPK